MKQNSYGYSQPPPPPADIYILEDAAPLPQPPKLRVSQADQQAYFTQNTKMPDPPKPPELDTSSLLDVKNLKHLLSKVSKQADPNEVPSGPKPNLLENKNLNPGGMKPKPGFPHARPRHGIPKPPLRKFDHQIPAHQPIETQMQERQSEPPPPATPPANFGFPGMLGMPPGQFPPPYGQPGMPPMTPPFMPYSPNSSMPASMSDCARALSLMRSVWM